MISHLLITAIKQKMEKDVDEVSRIARFIKSKIEALDREVRIKKKFLNSD